MYVHAEDIEIFGENSDVIYHDYTSLGVSIFEAFLEGHIEEQDVVMFMQKHAPQTMMAMYSLYPQFCKYIDDQENESLNGNS